MGGMESDGIKNVYIPSRSPSSTSDSKKSFLSNYSTISTRLHNPDFSILQRTTHLYAWIPFPNAFRSPTTRSHVFSSQSTPTNGRLPLISISCNPRKSHLTKTFPRRKFLTSRSTTTPLKTISTNPIHPRSPRNTNAIFPTTTISKNALPNRKPTTPPPTILPTPTTTTLHRQTPPSRPHPLPPSRPNPFPNNLP